VGDGSEVKDSTAAVNGSLVNSLYFVGSGIVGGSSTLISDCASISNVNWGIIVSNSCTVTGCSASYSNPIAAGYGGIVAGSRCTIIGCAANKNFGNGTGKGIKTGDGCTIKNCTASANGAGISGGNACNIIDCTASQNSVGSGVGIGGGDSSTVHGCIAFNNTFNGIAVASSSYVFDNLVALHSSGGIVVSGSNNVIIRNLVWMIFNKAATNFVPPILASTNNAIGTLDGVSALNTNKNPQANFAPQFQ
jgi:parallel beta-helix repeat protein